MLQSAPGMDTYFPERTTDFGVPENVMLASGQLSLSPEHFDYHVNVSRE
jgi:hypothetical protein